MPLLTIWKSAPDAVAQLTIEQIVSNAGDGVLKDYTTCSTELREYLAQIPSSKISSYIEHCLTAGFGKSGVVLQDLVNELGRRLDYKVENGRYQGTKNAVGFDGLWLSPEGHSIVVEVKTTDAYRISLDGIAEYRNKLLATVHIKAPSSILIIVGREDTGELEAQIRGSRHAWDMRLISADALIRLVELKENAENTETGMKIRSLLAPMEYTRLDGLIDVMFTTAKDVEEEIVAVEEATNEETLQTKTTQEKRKSVRQVTDRHALREKRGQILAALERQTGVFFIKKSRAQFWDASHKIRLVSTLSKRYVRKNSTPYYWFAHHPQWQTFLSEGEKGYLALGCVDLAFAFSIPLQTLSPMLDALNKTVEDNGQAYWHIQVIEPQPGKHAMLLPKRSDAFPLDSYRIDLEPTSSKNL